MPNVSFTDAMDQYIQKQIASGSYSNVSEVARAGLRLLMEQDGAKQFYALKAELQQSVKEAESGEFSEFDPRAYEPDAFK